MKVFTVYDLKSESYMPPFCVRAKGEAIRGFADQANDKNSAIGAHPSDYVLYELGDYDDRTAKFELLGDKLQVAVASDYVVQSV